MRGGEANTQEKTSGYIPSADLGIEKTREDAAVAKCLGIAGGAGGNRIGRT